MDDSTERLAAAHDGEVLLRTTAASACAAEIRWRWTSLTRDVAAVMPPSSLRSLDLAGQYFPVDEVTVAEIWDVSGQGDLSLLAVDGTGLPGDAVTDLLKRLPRLVSLDIRGLDIADRDVELLADAAPQLADLALGFSPATHRHVYTTPRLTGAALVALSSMTGLRRLVLTGVPVEDADVLCSAVWDRLQSVDLSDSFVGDAGAVRIAHGSALESVVLNGTRVGDDGAVALLGASPDTLGLSRTRVTVAGLQAAGPAPRLRHVELAGLALDDTLADVLSRWPALRRIDLTGVSGIGDPTALALARAPALLEATLVETSIGEAGLTALARSTAEVLDITGLPTPASVVEALAESVDLRRISMSAGADWTGLDGIRCELSLDAEPPRAGTPPAGLTGVVLRGPLSRDTSAALGELPRLRTIVTTGPVDSDAFGSGYHRLSEFSAAGCGCDDALVDGLLRLPGIEMLFLSDNPAISTAFDSASAPLVNTLELRHTHVSDAAIRGIAAMPRLHCLDLPGTDVSPAGIARLARDAVNLRSLAVDGTQVDSHSASALADRHELVELYLYYPSVDDDTIRRLRAITVRDLNLIDTRVTDASVPYLAALTGLRRVYPGAALTLEGRTELRRRRPDLTIE